MASSATSSNLANDVQLPPIQPPEVSVVNIPSPVDPGFTNISLEDISVQDAENPPKRKKKKVPRRILHFSDGILEEYSTDEGEEVGPPRPTVNPKTLAWSSWFWYYIAQAASNTLFVADSCGEKLAWFFGITSPKYQYAIDEYNRMKAEDAAEKEEDEMIKQQELDKKNRVLQSREENLDTMPSIAIVDKAPVVQKY